MTTALQLINRAAEIIGYKDPDETLSGNDTSAFLSVLNSVVDGWAVSTLRLYAVTELVQSVSGNPVSIGPSATINTTRPPSIPSGGFVRSGGNDYGFRMVDREEYAQIISKSTQSTYPEVCYYEASLPSGNLHFWPALSGTVELHLPIEQSVSQFADLSTDYTLAPGYKPALEYSLAEEIAPGRRPLDPQVQRLAMRYRRALDELDVPQLDSDDDCCTGNILSGWR